MGNISYSKKEIAIIEGLIGLIREGANPYFIKVSDIAKAANIGKGTIYDYFSSKEEAISEAILYGLSKEIESGYMRIKSKTGFKEKFYETLYNVVESVENNISIFNMLMSARGIQEFYEYLLEDGRDISEYMWRANDVIMHLIKTGISDGIIEPAGSDYYKTMVINSAIMGFTQYISRRTLYPDVKLEEAMDSAYKLVVKSLSP
ncbi:MAG: TetR/AcrR family transcriptional regulator [Clostridiales bacterium]|nr:TetR/AcrR family transcriptional regulator [Clostridiales bacterium]